MEHTQLCVAVTAAFKVLVRGLQLRLSFHWRPANWNERVLWVEGHSAPCPACMQRGVKAGSTLHHPATLCALCRTDMYQQPHHPDFCSMHAAQRKHRFCRGTATQLQLQADALTAAEIWKSNPGSRGAHAACMQRSIEAGSTLQHLATLHSYHQSDMHQHPRHWLPCARRAALTQPLCRHCQSTPVAG